MFVFKSEHLGLLPKDFVERLLFFFSSRRRHTRLVSDWSSDVCSSDLVQTLDLVQPEHKLFDLIESQIKAGGQPDVLCVVGLEYSLVDDIEPGDGGGQGDYYNPGTTPRILAHLNQNREKFRDSFPFVTIFFLPKFAQKYFTRRASDFVDWGSGIFELRTEIKTVLGQIGRASCRERV